MKSFSHSPHSKENKHYNTLQVTEWSFIGYVKRWESKGVVVHFVFKTDAEIIVILIFLQYKSLGIVYWEKL